MDQICVFQHAEDTILQSTVALAPIGTSPQVSKCADLTAEVPFAIACGTTATTATMDDATEVLQLS